MALVIRVVLVLTPLFASLAHAQFTGFEVALHGNTQVAYGDELRLSGVAYEVQGFADLRPLTGGEVVVRLRDYDQRRRRWTTVEELQVRPTAGGEFTFSLPVPERRFANPQLQLELRKGNKSRTFEWGVALRSPLAIDLLLDRNRYEPGEKVHVWARVFQAASGAPASGRTVRVQVTDPSGRPLTEERTEVGASGALSLDVELPDSAADGGYSVSLNLDDSIAGASAQRAFSVARRTVERVLVEANLDQQVVPPSGQLTGSVKVTTPSGNPVVGADVFLQIGDDRRQQATVQTNGQGIAPIRMQAPAYLAGDVQSQRLNVRVIHSAHGTLHTAADFLLSRVDFRVELTPEGGGIVPEVNAEALLLLTDPRGEPADAGTQVRVSGAAIRGGSVDLTVDAHGLAVVPVRVADGQAGPMTQGGCSGFGVSAQAEVLGDRPLTARLCLRVAPDARVRPRVRQRVIAPGESVQVDLARHPEVRGRPVLVEVLSGQRAIAATFARGDRAEIAIPSGVAGVLHVRARPMLRHDARHELTEPGGSSLTAGSSDAFVVRPADAFALDLVPNQDRYQVREQAQLELRTTQSSPQAWAALVVRDLAAHGGEGPWSLSWMNGAVADAAARPDGEGAELLLRAALVAGLSMDALPRREPPLVQPYWTFNRPNGGQVGTLRDPVAQRDQMRRRQVGNLANALERIVASIGSDPARAEGVLVRRGNRLDFDPGAIARLRRDNRLSESQADTLGGETATIAMIRAVDPSFSFDAVARRIARARLVELMMALSRFSNPDDPNAARASAGQPPERWLSRMVQLGVLRPAQLVDPWGHPYSFRRAARPGILISDRAATWELVSAGPDGRFGSRDDVRDPFERIVPEGTPYAVASGEDRLMKRLSTLAPGPQVLQRMASAYSSQSLAEREERRGRTVTATGSEQAEMMDGFASGGADMALGGVASSRSRPRRSATRAAPPADAPMPVAEAEPEEDAEWYDGDDSREEQRHANAQERQQGPGFAQLSTVIRERFPATLHYVGEIALDGTSTTVPVPLQDALTTYRVEAIAWTGSGWVSTAKTQLRVDQDATVDAPIPPFATVGDTLRIPVRVTNRTGQPIEARVVLEAEGLNITLPNAVSFQVPPRDAASEVIEVPVSAAGTGAIVVRALRASDDQPYDAVRRPLTIWEDARQVRVLRELLLEPGSDGRLSLEVPSDASQRGPAELRVVPATAIFGDLRNDANPIAAWALAVLGEEISEPALMNARNTLRAGDPVEEHDVHAAPPMVALALAATWRDATVQDPVMRRGLRAVSRVLGDSSEAPDPGTTLRLAEILGALGPCIRAGGRPSVQAPLDQLASELRQRVGDGAVAATDAPIVWARSAAALALSG
ncbi:MAG: MG2 domain-containing protein, partial [Myxococcota bacterium]